MGRVSFENYAARSRRKISYTEMAGRRSFQQEQEKNVPGDAACKLELGPEDDLLEIGCGTGNLLIPLAKLVRSATGIDHPDPLRIFRSRVQPGEITLIKGNFLDLRVEQRFSKILVYSVLLLLKDFDEVMEFVQRAMGLLRPGGAMLLGDMPNADKRKRFQATARGQAFEAQWQAWVAREAADSPAARSLRELPRDPELVDFDDEEILRILAMVRQQGYEAYVLPQPENLPMCFSREDILIRRLER